MEVLRCATCVLLLVLQLVLVMGADQGTAANPANATTEFKCEQEGTFPDPKDCHSYYWCTSQLKANRVSCFWGTYYNPNVQGCTIGGCSIWTKPQRFGLPQRNQTTTTQEEFQCPTIGQFPNPKDCRGYYKCDSNMRAQPHYCWPWFHYDIDNSVCSPGWC